MILSKLIGCPLCEEEGCEAEVLTKSPPTRFMCSIEDLSPFRLCCVLDAPGYDLLLSRSLPPPLRERVDEVEPEDGLETEPRPGATDE